MKRILILANNDVGLYKFRKELIQALINEGNKVYISLPYGRRVDYLVEMGCEFIDTSIDRRGINPITDFKLMLNYKTIIRKIKPNLILTYTIKPNVYGGLLSRLYKIPYIVNITGLGTAFQSDSIIKKIIVKLYKLALNKVNYVFFENEENKKIFVENNTVDPNICVVMSGAGVNLDEYKFTPMPDYEAIRFLFIGRVMKEKGVDELFAVARKIKSKNNNVQFDIVGPFEDDYKETVEQLQKDNIINYYGYQEDVRTFIAKSSCIILPSYHEGMANVLLEAGSMGRPLIASDIPGCKEAVEAKEYLCKIKDEESLYINIKKFINLDNYTRKALGKKSREHIEQVFDKNKVVAKTMSYINKVWRENI